MIVQKKDPVDYSADSFYFLRIALNTLRYAAYFLLFILILFLLANQKYFGNNLYELSQKVNKRLFGESEYTISTLSEIPLYIQGAIIGLATDDDFVELDLSIEQDKLLQIFQENKRSQERKFYSAKFTLNQEGENIALRTKVRGKGDRELHFQDLNSMSFRANLKGEDRLFGIEEFSIQKPIIRNYSWEFLLAEVFRLEGLLTLNSWPIRFSVNGDFKGIYSLEEVPSKETIELQKRKNGPIFGLDENISTSIDTILDPYDFDDWKDSEIFESARGSLYKSFQSALESKPFSKELFDMDEWSRYFALIDVFGAYHGAVPKSVKFYFNPVIGKFQPILFDGHVGGGKWDDFILLDWAESNAIVNCEWICADRRFFQGFLKEEGFIDKYTSYLLEYSEPEFIESIKNIYYENFQYLDYEYYSRFSPGDLIFHSGPIPYFFKFNRIDTRNSMIRKKLMKYLETNQYLSNSEGAPLAQELIVDTNINIVKYKDWSLTGTEFKIMTPTIFVLEGLINLRGLSKTNVLKISGPGMFIFQSSNVNLENIQFDSARSIPIQNRNLSGALNFVNSNVISKNISVINADAEDSINYVNSEIAVDEIFISNSFSDAIDLDFSEGTISKLICKNIGNDCLDLSESKLSLGEMSSTGVQDKAISLGENSYLEANELTIVESAIGAVSKDGSSLLANILNIDNVSLPVAVFNKKPSYNNAYLEVIKLNSNNESFGLFSDNSVIKIPESIEKRFMTSDEIEGLMYGSVYGKATEK